MIVRVILFWIIAAVTVTLVGLIENRSNEK